MPFFANATISIHASTVTPAATYKKANNNAASSLYTGVSANLRPVDGAFDADGNQGFTAYVDISSASALLPSIGDKYRINDGTYDYKVVAIEKNTIFSVWKISLVRKRQ